MMHLNFDRDADGFLVTLCGIKSETQQRFIGIRSYVLGHVGTFGTNYTHYFDSEIKAVVFNEWCPTCLDKLVKISFGEL